MEQNRVLITVGQPSPAQPLPLLVAIPEQGCCVRCRQRGANSCLVYTEAPARAWLQDYQAKGLCGWWGGVNAPSPTLVLLASH